MEYDDDLNFLLKNYSSTLWRPSSPIIFALGFHQDSFAHSRPVTACSIASVYTASKAAKFFPVFIFLEQLVNCSSLESSELALGISWLAWKTS